MFTGQGGAKEMELEMDIYRVELVEKADQPVSQISVLMEFI